MEILGANEGHSQWGTVTVEDVTEGTLLIGDTRSESIIASIRRCVWTPSADLRDELPEGHQLELFYDVARDGIRRFYFTYGVPTFALRASAGGVAISNRRGELLDEGQLFNFRLM